MVLINYKLETAIEFASEAMKLLKPKIFDKAAKAAMQEDFQEFSEACVDAGIPDVDAERGFNGIHLLLYKMLRAGLTDYTMFVWP